MDLRQLRKVAKDYQGLYRKMAVERGWPLDMPSGMAGVYLAQAVYTRFNIPMAEGQLSNATTQWSNLVNMCWMVAWRQYGSPCFKLSHSLTSALLLTSPDNVLAESVEWPFDSLCLELPTPNGPLTFSGLGDKPHDMTFITAHRMGYTPDDVAYKAYADAVGRAIDAPDPVKAFEALPKLTDSSKVAVFIHTTDGSRRGYYGVDISPSDRLGDVLKVRRKELQQVPGQTLDSIDAALRLLFNFLLHLDARSKNGRPVEKKVRGVGSPEGPYDQYEVHHTDPETGTNIQLEPELMQAAREWCQKGRKPERWKLTSQVVVMGHWRNVPYGPLNVDPRPTRPRHIAAYKRGPENTDPMVHNYTTKEKKDVP